MSYRGNYKKEKDETYKISRSGIESFVKCPRCFYLDKKLGVKQPAGFPFNLNSAVDHLLKKEFDIHRTKGTPHPLMQHYGVDAIPFFHEDIDIWRENFKGLEYLDKKNNLLITGAIDDVWVNKNGELFVVDYKSTSKEGKVGIDAEWQNSYKRQMEIYQWLLRKNGFKVSNTGYFVYCNGKKDKEAFDGKLEFDIDLIPYKGDDSWVEGHISKLKKLLNSEKIPPYTETCDYCKYQKGLDSIK